MPEQEVVLIGAATSPLVVILLGAMTLLLLWTLSTFIREGRGAAHRAPKLLLALLLTIGILPVASYTYRRSWPLQRWAMRASLYRGEQLFARYLVHFDAQGHFPGLADTLDEADLSHFDKVVDLKDSPNCDGQGIGCRALEIKAHPTLRDSLELHVYEGTIECSLTALGSGWLCRDHF